MEKYFELGRSYYTYLKKRTKKNQCTVSVVCDNIDMKHNLIDGLLFDGAFIYDGYCNNVDGYITVVDGNIELKGCSVSELEFDHYVPNPNGTVIKK